MDENDKQDGPAQNARAVAGSNAAAQLKAFVERTERLTEERKTYSDDIRDVYAEAKGNGYDVKALRKVIASRAKDRGELAELNAVCETYANALGMVEW